MTQEHARKIGFITIGCRANQADTARMESQLDPATICDSNKPSTCDVLVINTCAVTTRAEADARKLIRRAARANPKLKIIVTGCAAQVEPDKWLAMPEVSNVVGVRDRDDLITVLDSPDEKIISIPPSGGVLGPTPLIGHRSRPFLKIQDGCSRGCSYCIVPRARGPERSRPPEMIVDDLRTLAQAGYREIVITGVHLGRWGHDLDLDFNDLLSILENTGRQARIRLSSLEPMDLTTDLIRRMLQNPMICPHFHLPLQSGNQAILDSMKRGHTLADYANLLDCIRSESPDAAIGTDLMVGFPGETENIHRNTLDFIRNLPLTYLHIFKFSPRPGTPAANMPHCPYGPDVHRRMKELRQLDNSIRESFLQSQIGKTREFLVETPQSSESPTTALSDNYLRISVHDSNAINSIGNLINLTIDNM